MRSMLTVVIVASLPPRPPPSIFPSDTPSASASAPSDPPPALLPADSPPAPPSYSRAESYLDSSDRSQWHGVRVQFARLQHRDNQDHEWSTIDEAYDPLVKTERVSEPYNVEQVYFLEDGGIQLRQCDAQWTAQINAGGRKQIEHPESSFIVTFKGISNIIISEKRDKITWCIVMFTCSETPRNESETLRPEVRGFRAHFRVHLACNSFSLLTMVPILMLLCIRWRQGKRLRIPARSPWLP